MEEVEARIAELQEEIEEDKINDENVDDQFEMMIQSTLTVSIVNNLKIRHWINFSNLFLVHQRDDGGVDKGGPVVFQQSGKG